MQQLCTFVSEVTEEELHDRRKARGKKQNLINQLIRSVGVDVWISVQHASPNVHSMSSPDETGELATRCTRSRVGSKREHVDIPAIDTDGERTRKTKRDVVK